MKRFFVFGIFFCLLWSFAALQAQTDGAMVRVQDTYTIGPGGDYSTFTQAINFLNGLPSIPAPGITFLVSSGATFNENPPAITRSASDAAPVVFVKNGDGVNPQILATGTSAGGEAIIRLDGVKYYIFDGIDVANAGNTTAMEFGYHLLNGAAYNKIKNSKITLSRNNARSRGVYTLNTAADICHHNLYQNLDISNVKEGVYILGSGIAIHTHEIVQDCTITNAINNGIFAPCGSNLEIRNNRIQPVSFNNALFTAIHLGGSGSSAIVEGNRIVNVQVGRQFYGINFAAGDAIIQNNFIANISGSSSEMIGIRVMGGDATITQNTITGFSNTGGKLIGIEIKRDAGDTQVLGNLISGFECNANHNINSYATGMILGGANCLAVNNMIGGINFNSSVQPASTGIRTIEGNIRLYYNSIRLDAEAFGTTSSSACVYIETEGSNVELIDNIMANYSVPGSNGKTVDLWKESPGFGGLSAACSNNLFWLATNDTQHIVAQIGATGYLTLPDYQAASGLEQNSHFGAPSFIGADDLHLDPEIDCLAKNNALPLPEVSVDFDGQARDATTPDIGADEALAIPEDPWEVSATELDFGYVCSGESPATRSLTISNLGMSALIFDSSCFTLVGFAGFELLTEQLIIPPLSSGDLQLTFGGVGTGERDANLIISKAGMVRNISLFGILNAALEMPVKANWETGFDGWIPRDEIQNKWQITTEQSFKDNAALTASPAESSLIHLFADVVLPSSSPRLIVNLLHQGVDIQDFSLWLVATNYTPQAGSLPGGLRMDADLGAAGQWNRVEYTIPTAYVGQTVRLVLSFDAAPAAKVVMDNLRLLGAAQQLLPPQEVEIIKLDQGAKVTWAAQQYANEYLVEVSDVTIEGFTPLQSTGNTELPVSTDDDKRFYRVIAFE
jgi:hypothetical protein